jgi:putative transposase
MIDRSHALPITRQAEALGMARSTVYALPTPIPDRDLDLMKRIDRLHLEMPYAGSRMLRDLLNQDGIKVGRKHVATLMKRMGIEALYRKPKTTKKHPQHRVYPYLLRGLSIDRPNQVFAMDITYIPMARGFVYLVAVLDWYSRKVLSWRVSITMDVDFCLEALEEAINVHGVPEIVNTDQGSQFTSQAFTGLLKKKGIRISMDGKGAWRDNVFIERLWRSVKYEEVYLHAYDTVSDSRAAIGKYFNLYNRRRPHSSLKRKTPDQVYYSQQPLTLAA